MDKVITDEEDRVVDEKKRTKEALIQCAYPEWAFKKPQPKQQKISDAKTDKPERPVVRPFGRCYHKGWR